MTPKERVRMAFDQLEPDRVPVFEIHIDCMPASEILGRFAPTGYAGSVSKLRNEMRIAGRLGDWHQEDMTYRLELCQKLDLDIIRAFPYQTNPPNTKVIGDNTWRVEDKHGYWSIHKFVSESDNYAEVDSSISRGGIDKLEQLVKDMEQCGTSLVGCATDGLSMVNEMYQRGPSLDGISFRNLEWIKETAPDLCVMGWADAAFFHNSWMSVLLEAMIARPRLVDRWMEVNLQQILLYLEAQL